MDITATANALLPLLGGKENIASAAHCATRLRLVLVDDSKVDKEAIGKLDGVKGCFSNAGQIQVIFGTGLVNKVHAEFIKAAGVSESSKAEAADIAAKSSTRCSASPACCRTSSCLSSRRSSLPAC